MRIYGVGVARSRQGESVLAAAFDWHYCGSLVSPALFQQPGYNGAGKSRRAKMMAASTYAARPTPTSMP